MSWHCRQHGQGCQSYVVAGIKSLNRDGVTLENIRQKYNEGLVNLEDLFFIIKCLTWTEAKT
jgi:hypothetical protein